MPDTNSEADQTFEESTVHPESERWKETARRATAYRERQEQSEGKGPTESQKPEMSLVLAPEAQADPAVQQMLKSVSLKLRTWTGEEIEVPLSEINATATTQAIPRTGRFTLCGNCGDRIPRGRDAQEDHHNAMRHKFTCPKRHQAAQEHAELVRDYEAQPNVQAMHAAYSDQVRAGIPGDLRIENLKPFHDGQPLRLPSAPAALARPQATEPAAPPAKWWQFWK